MLTATERGYTVASVRGGALFAKWSAGEMAVAANIATRAEALWPKDIPMFSKADLLLCLRAACASVEHFDMERLLAFGNFDFMHDIGGLLRHMRDDGTLADHFWPRCARPPVRVQP